MPSTRTVAAVAVLAVATSPVSDDTARYRLARQD